MPFDANGNFSLVPGTIVADGMNVLPSQHNPPFQDVANGLSQVVVRDGRAPMTGPLNMNGNKITGVAAGDAPDDVVTNARIADLGVAIGDGKWSLRDLSPNWLRRDGKLYEIDDYPELAELLPALPDGVSWSNVTGLVGSVEALLVTDTGYLAATRDGSNTNVYTSSDARSWAVVATIPTFSAAGLIKGNGIYVLLDANGKACVSNDGITWSTPAYAIGSGSDGIGGGAFIDGLFVIVGLGGKISTSPDGVAWTARTSGTTQLLWRARAFGNVVVAVGANGTIISSPDGINWSPHTSGVSATLYDIAYDGSLYVAVGASGTIITSATLTGWTSRASGTTQQLTSIVASSAGLLAVGRSGIARISAAGTSWAASATGVSSHLLYVIFDPDQESRYLVGGASGTLLEGIRTLPTQFRVPSDDPAYGWVRAL